MAMMLIENQLMAKQQIMMMMIPIVTKTLTLQPDFAHVVTKIQYNP